MAEKDTDQATAQRCRSRARFPVPPPCTFTTLQHGVLLLQVCRHGTADLATSTWRPSWTSLLTAPRLERRPEEVWLTGYIELICRLESNVYIVLSKVGLDALRELGIWDLRFCSLVSLFHKLHENVTLIPGNETTRKGYVNSRK